MYEQWRKTSAFFSPTASWHAEAWTCIPGAIRQRVALMLINLTHTVYIVLEWKILFEIIFVVDKIKLMRFGWWMPTEIAINLFLTASLWLYRTMLIDDIQLRKRCRVRATRSFSRTYVEGALRWSKKLVAIFRRQTVSFKNGNWIASFYPQYVLRILESLPMELNSTCACRSDLFLIHHICWHFHAIEMLNNWTQFSSHGFFWYHCAIKQPRQFPCKFRSHGCIIATQPIYRLFWD